MCEEFHCLPSAAYLEWLEAPVGLLETIIEYRGFAGAKAMYDRATTPEAQRALPASPMIALVKRFEYEDATAVTDAR